MHSVKMSVVERLKDRSQELYGTCAVEVMKL